MFIMIWAIIVETVIVIGLAIYLIQNRPKYMHCPKCGQDKYIKGPTYNGASNMLKWACTTTIRHNIGYISEWSETGCGATWSTKSMDSDEVEKEKLLEEILTDNPNVVSYRDNYKQLPDIKIAQSKASQYAR
jgi:hypothetical protein